MADTATVILLAAGSGQRFGSQIPKCFYNTNGQTIVEKSFETIRSLDFVKKILVAVPEAQLNSAVAKKLESAGALIFQGGNTRRQSVSNGIKLLNKIETSSSPLFCLVHDAARMFASRELFERTFVGAKKHQAVTAAIKSVDSLKEVLPDGKVVKSLNREQIYSVQTPQCFYIPLLIKAHEQWDLNNNSEPTDDASMVEQIHPVYIVEGEQTNKKITFADDINFDL